GRVPLRELGGPIAIARAAGQQARAGFRYFLSMLAFLSINLAVLNLLPIPALDGGHLAFFTVEAVMRRPLRPQHRELAQRVGLLVGLALAKGIAFAGRLPLVPVPTLEALAWVAEATSGETVCAALDARKREVYAAFFRIDAGGRPCRLTPDAALSPQELAARLE